MIDEASIRDEVLERHRGYVVTITVDWLTPAGRPRKVPMYEAFIDNDYLGTTKVVKGKSEDEVKFKATQQMEKWAVQEVRKRINEAKEDAVELAAQDTSDAKAEIEAISNILNSTLDVDDRIDWNDLLDSRQMPAFRFNQPKPQLKKRTFWQWLIPSRWQKALQEHDLAVNSWEIKRKQAQSAYEKEEIRLEQAKKKHNDSVALFKEGFESGEPNAIVEYVNAVFERSVYPQSFNREYSTSFDPTSETIVVDLSLPNQESIPNVVEYKIVKKTGERKVVLMKKKDHDELYDNAVKQCVLRTVHEVFESVYTPHVQAIVVNGWVTYVDKATGNDKRSCVISISTDRDKFEDIKLDRIDVTECIKGLKGLIAGPLSNVCPVKPIMQLNREDGRFVEAQDVLADYNSETNLAELPWDQFEHLVRELFGKLFSNDEAEVKVTQASKDGGVDAIAFDPDPIRGGRFVIQAKRYTKVVPVSAVRDLYGTMLNEGASRGILVTTSHFGRDSHSFAQDKPITLINGSNLVYLLEQHGHKVRIDVNAAIQARKAMSQEAYRGD